MARKLRRDLSLPRDAAITRGCPASATLRRALLAKIAPTVVIRRTAPVGANVTQSGALADAAWRSLIPITSA